jgi:periplasmic protein TonB
MSSYQGTAGRRDRAKAIAAVVAVHAALAFVILTGLNVRNVSEAVERLKTFDIAPPPPPPPPPPQPKAAPKTHAMKKPAGAPAPKAEPTPVVAPPRKIPLPSPIAAARVAGSGSAASSGAAGAGNGTGAGGAGNGAGGGGSDYLRFTPAQLIRNLTRGDYRSIAQGRLSTGRAMVTMRVEPTGVPSHCRVIRSSGDPVVDGGLCPLIEARLRFSPALDDHGRPIVYELQYVATWRL